MAAAGEKGGKGSKVERVEVEMGEEDRRGKDSKNLGGQSTAEVKSFKDPENGVVKGCKKKHGFEIR